MSKRTGVVAKVYEKEWEGRDGMIVLHSFQLDGDRQYYRTGEQRLVKEGEAYTFDADQKGNVDPDSVETADPETVERPKASTSGRGFGGSGGRTGGKSWGNKGGGAKNDYWERKETHDREVVEPRITWASAQSDAVDLVSAALQHDLLSFGNAAKGAKLGLLLDYVDQVTARFATQRYNAAELLKDALRDEEKAPRASKKEDNDLE